MTNRQDIVDQFTRIAAERVLVKDGPYGTMVQAHALDEDGFRGDRFADFGHDLKGNNDILNITQARIVRDICDQYLEAGADIVATNTFNANRISQADYGAEHLVHEINHEAARITRAAADAAMAADPARPRLVAGAMGPTNKTLSVSPDVNNPGFREVTFDDMKEVYAEQAIGLLDGGADVLLVETVFDTLNAKAALVAIDELSERRGAAIPVMVSLTITDLAGRNLSGQTVEAFWHSVRHARPFSIGLNCSFGAEQLRPHAVAIAKAADTLVCVYPNAGLPNEMGEYDECPEVTSGHMGDWARAGLVNIVGGCCGTTPDHIRAIARAVTGLPPRPIPQPARAMRLSGLEAVTMDAAGPALAAVDAA